MGLDGNGGRSVFFQPAVRNAQHVFLVPEGQGISLAAAFPGGKIPVVLRKRQRKKQLLGIDHVPRAEQHRIRQKRVGSRQLRRVRPAQKDAQSGGFLFQTGTQAADAALIAHFPGEPPQGQGAALGGAQFAGHSVVRVRPQPFQQSGP